jgi:uncharacterized membrane protein YsdA (DUF1294 family)
MIDENLALLSALILAGLNIFSFIIVGWDKSKSVHGNPRIPEVYFFFLATVFGSAGVLLGMSIFRHKIRKWYFNIGISLLLLEQFFLIYLFANYFLELKIVIY